MDSIKGIKIEDLLPILDSISTPIFIDDANGNTLLANKASEILYDFDRDEIIGENVCLLEKEGIFSSSVAKLVIENRKKSTIINRILRFNSFYRFQRVYRRMSFASTNSMSYF